MIKQSIFQGFLSAATVLALEALVVILFIIKIGEVACG
jgi:hypothetical protein